MTVGIVLLLACASVDARAATTATVSTSSATDLVATSTPGDILAIETPSSATELAVQFDIPVRDDHPDVELWIRHFQARGRERFRLWMARSGRVAPTYDEVLSHYGLPLDLRYLSMIESGFSPRAYSWAHASGPWQFIPGTARRFGLTCDSWVDERRDLEKSTHAAARYLAILYAEFGDWHLAWAAYNAGEARVRRAIRRGGTNDFWSLVDTRHLPRETRRYVPKLVAAALVSKAPEIYGLEHPEYHDPVVSSVVTVTVATDLATIARACGGDVTEEELIDLNPALYRHITPPGRTWRVRVPRFFAADCEMRLRAMPDDARLTYRFHPLRPGDTASKIAERYGSEPQAILTHNRITDAQLSNFEGLVVPISLARDREVPILDPIARWRYAPPYTPDSPPVRIHRVRSGDSLWRIANRYRVSIRKLRSWNGLWRRRYLRVGERRIIRGHGG